MFVRVEVRKSNIFGKGLFPTEEVKRGTIVCSFTTDAKVITEREYVEAIEKNEYLIVRTGTRYVGRYFTYTQEPDTELNFFNHSFEPNLLCHCGVVIALRNIGVGEEFTIDYRTLIDDTDIGVYKDAKSGEVIKGFSARETLLRTTRLMLELMESVGEDWEG
jgi:SET domain-containing protein